MYIDYLKFAYTGKQRDCYSWQLVSRTQKSGGASSTVKIQFHTLLITKVWFMLQIIMHYHTEVLHKHRDKNDRSTYVNECKFQQVKSHAERSEAKNF